MTGWYTKLRQAKKKRDQLALALTNDSPRPFVFYPTMQVLSFPEPTILRYEALRAAHRHVGKSDLRIAAIVLEHADILVTKKSPRLFSRFRGSKIEDWSK